MKKGTTIKLIIGIVTIVALAIGASYAYFSNARTSVDLTIDSSVNITYTISASSTLSLDVNPYAALNSTVIAQNTISTDTVYLKNDTGASNLTCGYEIWYTPTKTFTNSTANTNNETELAILGSESSNQNASFSFDLNGISSATKMYDGVISTNGTLTQTWSFTMVHYNLDVEQSSNINKSFTGSISFVAKSCQNKKTAYSTINSLLNSSNSNANGSWTVKNENGLRYEGKNPNNYICFKDSCSASELYRIIGVVDDNASSGATMITNKLLKVVKSSSYSSAAYGSNNNWPSSSTYSTLNNAFLNSASVSNVSAKMLKGKWNLLVPTSYSSDASTWFTGERSGQKYSSNQSDVLAKVGLIYPSDYIYASYESGSCVHSSSYVTDCNTYNWLSTGSAMWTISPDSANTTNAILINSSGTLASTASTTSAGIYPAFYLPSNVYLTGSGTASNPYTIS